MPGTYRHARGMTTCPVCQRLMPIVTGQTGQMIEWHFIDTCSRALCTGSAQPVPAEDNADAVE